MIKLIIVEDEPLMNEYIVNCIDYSKFGIEQIGTFFNGESAYEFICKNKVDIVITDIQMPRMDGLELISKTLEKYAETKFIVLSNFDDFHMVKQAFKYGATDYILKTDFEPKVFTKVLMDIISTKIPKQTDKLGIAIRETALKQFFWDDLKTNHLNNMRFRPDDKLFVCVVKLINYDVIIKNEWNTKKELMKFGLSNCFDEILDEFGDGEFFFNDYDEIVFLFSASLHSPHESSIRGFFERIFEILSVNFSITASAGICDNNNVSSLKEQHQLAVKASEYSFIYGKNKLIEHSLISNFHDTVDTAKITKGFDDLVNSFKFDELFEMLEELGTLKPDYMYIPSLRAFYRFALNHLIKLSETYETTGISELLTSVHADIDSIDELNGVMLNALRQLSASLTHSDIAIMQIQNYIYKNYSQDITLQFLAKQFLFNYSDLSRRFRKATGMSFSKFLINIRLEEAMRLINTTDYRFSQIASMVGYNNYENFSRAFKNKYKKWPNEFRKGDKP